MPRMSGPLPDQPDLVHEALLGTAADCAGVGISVYDDTGRMVAVNRQSAELLGYSRNELLKHDVGDFTNGGIDRNVLRSPRLREGVRLVNRSDGTTVPVAFVVAPTTVAGLPYYVSVSWEIPADDPRA